MNLQEFKQFLSEAPLVRNDNFSDFQKFVENHISKVIPNPVHFNDLNMESEDYDNLYRIWESAYAGRANQLSRSEDIYYNDYFLAFITYYLTGDIPTVHIVVKEGDNTAYGFIVDKTNSEDFNTLCRSAKPSEELTMA